jgi:hypothetical protein
MKNRNRERLYPVLPIVKKKINADRPTLDFLLCDSKHTYIFFWPMQKKKIIHSFSSTLIIYLLVVYKKKIIHSYSSTFVKDLG